MVGVAQLVEPRVVIPVVVGSSPIVHPNSFLSLILDQLNALQVALMAHCNALSGLRHDGQGLSRSRGFG